MNNYQWYTEQWGKPEEDDLLFLLLTVGVSSWFKLESSSREKAFMKFCQMKPEKVAALLPDEVDRIVADPDMIRNRRIKLSSIKMRKQF